MLKNFGQYGVKIFSQWKKWLLISDFDFIHVLEQQKVIKYWPMCKRMKHLPSRMKDLLQGLTEIDLWLQTSLRILAQSERVECKAINPKWLLYSTKRDSC